VAAARASGLRLFFGLTSRCKNLQNMVEDDMRMKSQLLTGIALAGFLAVPALAQTAPVPAPAAPAAEAEEIIVTGIRASLQASQALKRNADTIVDAISAEDVGKFPDANIAESLQRITGVSIDRNGGDGQFITVRGLGPEFNNVLVNGRTMATDNAGREFSFDVLSSSLIQKSEVYKSSQANLQEGGIGATVNIATPKPFDYKGTKINLSAGGIYDRLASKFSPDINGTFSTQNADQTIGVLVSVGYTNRKSQRDFVDVNGYVPFSATNSTFVINAPATSTGLPVTAVGRSSGAFNVAQNINYNRAEESRKRFVASAAVQARPTEDVLITLDGLYSKFDVKAPRTFFAGFFGPPFINPTVNAAGTVTGFNRPGTQFLGSNPLLAAAGVPLSQNDNVVTSNDRFTKTYQFGFNTKWDAADNLKIEFDYGRSQAKQRALNPFVVVGALATTSPRFDLNTQAGGLPLFTNLGVITDPAAQRLHYAQIIDTKYKDTTDEFQLNAKWEAADGSFLKSISAGAYYLKRNKTNTRADTGSEAFCAYCGYQVAVNPSLIRPYTLDGFLKGVPGAASVPQNFFTFDPYAVLAYASLPTTLATPGRTGGTPAQQAVDTARLLALPGGVYTPRDRPGSGINVTEKVTAGYVMAGFGGDLWSGNVGVRIVNTKTTSAGFQALLTSAGRASAGDDQLSFTFGPATAISVKNSYTDILPSANLKFDASDDAVLRFAVSKTVTRPTLTSLGTDNTYAGRVNAPLSGGGNPSLKPFKSLNFDASAEYYLSKTSYVSAAVFHKRFSDFLETATVIVPRFGFNFQDTRTRNGEKGSITGFEIGGQYAFDNGALDGFGVTGNYTYVNSSVKRAIGSASADCDYNGLSPHSFNASGFYEKNRIQARVSYNWRAAFLRQCQGDQGRPSNRASYGQADFSLGYQLTDNFQIYAEGNNVLGTKTRDYSVLRERFTLLQDIGSRYNFGVRANF
jgi:iron complex outermembrane recepter protein